MAWEETPTLVSSNNNNDSAKKIIPSICLGIPYNRDMTMYYFKSLYTVNLPPKNDMIFDGGSRPLDTSRNTIVTQALQNKFEYLMWVDTDIVFPDDMIINKLLQKKEKIVSALYFMRANPEIVVGSALGGRMLKNDDPEIKSGQLIDMDHVGMGACLTHMSIYREIGKKLKWRCLNNHDKDLGKVVVVDYEEAEDNNFSCPVCKNILIANYFLHSHGKFSGTETWEDGQKIPICSEDYFLCEQARRAGFKIKLAADVDVWHEAQNYLISKDGLFTMSVVSGQR